MSFMTFEHPEFLWFLLSLPLLIITHFAFLRKAKIKGMKFANFDAMKRVTGKTLITKNYTMLFVRLATIFVIVMAVSGTTIWYKGQVSVSDYVVALDVSSSMTAQDVYPSRFDAAKLAAKEFVGNLTGDVSVGVVTFSGETFISQPLHRNKFLSIDAINRAKVLKAGGTDISNALVTSANVLSTSNKSKAIIIITDGSNTQGEFIQRSVTAAVNYLQEQHVIVYGFSVGTGDNVLGYLPEYYNISAIFDIDGLRNISRSTGGELYSANTPEDFRRGFGEIHSTEEGFIKLELSWILIVTALILLFIEWGLANTRFRRVA